MEQQTTPNAAMTALLERYQEMVETPGQEDLERDIFVEAWEGNWQEALRLLRLLPGPVTRETAGEYLFQALCSAPPQVFAELLDYLPHGEYTGRATVPAPWMPGNGRRRHHRWEVRMEGTLTLLAAAKNRPAHLAVLLGRGYDVNSASLTAAAALEDAFGCDTDHYGADYVPYHPFTARPESRLYVMRHDADPEDISPLELEGVTPLAAAILFGHGECARVLMERGAWRMESPGVSQAMWLAWREKDETYRTVRDEVAASGGGRPVLWALCPTCSPGQLDSVLRTWAFPREEMVAAARKMLVEFQFQDGLWQEPEQGWKDLCCRLRLVGRACPEALCAPEAAGELLDRCADAEEWELAPFLPILEGRTVDLSQISGHLLLGRREEYRMLETLAAHCTLVMDREGVSMGTPPQALRLLMKHVTFLPPTMEQGVSDLTIALLRSASPKLIAQALRQGVIPPEETTEELLHCQMALKLPPVCRALLLTVPRPAVSRLPEPRRLIRRGLPRWFRECFSRNVMPILEERDWERWFYPLLCWETADCLTEAAGERWQMNSILYALCMRGETEVVARWLRYSWEELWNTDTLYCRNRRWDISVTPLCAAALAGQTDTVRLLLDHGAPAAEEQCGWPSVWSFIGQETRIRTYPITPLLAALMGGHWETARLLLDHGAVCDLREERNRELCTRIQKEDLESAAASHLGAYRSGDGVLRGKGGDSV